MKLVTYAENGRYRTGVIVDGKIVDLNQADNSIPSNMVDLLEAGDGIMSRVVDVAKGAYDGLLVDRVQLKPPVLNPGKVLCLGLNYRTHADEAGMAYPEYPVLFHKSRTSLIGHKEAVHLPAGANECDYEAELAVIIGKRAKNVSEAEALNYVAGYACANDVSERGWQFRTSQWTTGKMIDTFGPLGPMLVTKDEIPNPNALQIQLTYNGQEMQNSNTADQIFHIPFTIAYISTICTLEPGDVIMTGTPSGVGFSQKPPIALKEGDVMTVSIEGLGSLTNHVVQD